MRGVARMVEEKHYCIDILNQIRAVRAALGKVEQEIVVDHCSATEAFHGGTQKERQTKIDEVIELLDNRHLSTPKSKNA